MGATLYIGSMQSDLYFCLYEKAYGQLVKNGTPLEQADIQNRFEIRLKNERADNAVYDLVSNENPEQTPLNLQDIAQNGSVQLLLPLFYYTFFPLSDILHTNRFQNKPEVKTATVRIDLLTIPRAMALGV